MDLIIVESPTKARTLAKFLGRDFDIKATKGHIKDLPKSKLSVDVDNNFKPEYVWVEKRSTEIKEIAEAFKKASAVYLATDPDREGEAISEHVKEVLLQEKAKNGKKLQRIVFHEITKEAVEDALNHPRDVDKNLVDAQIARRVLDRLVGYKLSPLLWKKVRRGLSAGRVQTVAVKLIVEREKGIEAFKADEFWEIFATVVGVEPSSKEFIVQLIKVGEKKADVKNGKAASEIEADLKSSDFKVLAVARREVVKNPYPPFTTSTMTQAGARLFSWSAKRTMSVAQKLYEQGHITYHRTDSTSIAPSAIEKVRKFIGSELGEKYLPASARFYKTKSKVAQEAHEAIRPTNVNVKNAEVKGKFAREEGILYDLIWRRFVASQMASSVYDETRIDVLAKPDETRTDVLAAKEHANYTLRASGQIMKFDGWRKVLGKKVEDEVVNLPDLEKNESLKLLYVKTEQKFTQPPPRYNESSLIKTLEKLGIGRPSTYAPIISTIQSRQYVEKKEGRFFATPVGVAVTDFLVKHFPDVFDYSFTAKMEDDLDNVANGTARWQEEIKDFWNSFSKKLTVVDKESKRVKIEAEKLGKNCPECKEGELVIRIGRFGKFISCSRFPDCKFTDKYVEKIKMKCPKCGEGDVIIKNTKSGRKFFGCSRYPQCDWASWRNPLLTKSK